MDNTTTPMHVVQAKEDLLCNLLNEVHGDALVLMSLDQAEQILAQDLKNHADVGAIGSFVSEVIQELNDMGFAWMRVRGRWWRVWVLWCGCYGWRIRRDESLEKLDLVQRCLCVSWR
jgi:hypothetical protein